MIIRRALVVDDDVWMWSSSWFARSLLPDPVRDWSHVSGCTGR